MSTPGNATSTPVGDLSEMKAASKLFAENKKLHISATKSAIGHLLGGAGAVEAIICIKAFEQGMLPPKINTQTIDPELPQGLNIITGQAVKKDINVAISNTFGFGGHNATAVFRKWDV